MKYGEISRGKSGFFGPNFHIAYLSKGVVRGCIGYLWQSYCSLLALENAILTHLQPTFLRLRVSL